MLNPPHRPSIIKANVSRTKTMSRKKTSSQQRRSKKNTRHSSTQSKNTRSRSSKSTRQRHPSSGKKGFKDKTALAQPNADSDLIDDSDQTVVLLFNKPFQVLCQFTDQDDRETLANYISIPNLYAAGRLDRDSEGLLLLTNNGMLQHRISHPDFKLPKTYLVQVEGDVSGKAIKQLCDGVKLNDGISAPATAERVDEPDWLWPRNPPIRFRKDIPTSWIQLTITEGRNRQVRRMSAAVGYPTLRLLRTHIGKHCVVGINPGEYREVSETFG